MPNQWRPIGHFGYVDRMFAATLVRNTAAAGRCGDSSSCSNLSPFAWTNIIVSQPNVCGATQSVKRRCCCDHDDKAAVLTFSTATRFPLRKSPNVTQRCRDHHAPQFPPPPFGSFIAGHRTPATVQAEWSRSVGSRVRNLLASTAPAF